MTAVENTPSKMVSELSPSKVAALSPSRMGMMPAGMDASPHSAAGSECLCPTCQYYRAAMMYHHDPQSPQGMVDNFNFYQPSPSPMAMNAYGAYPQMGAPQMGGAGFGPQAFGSEQAMSTAFGGMGMGNQMMAPQMGGPQGFGGAQDENVNPVARNIVSQFKLSIGSLAATACSSSGRSLLQSVIRLQHADKIATIFEEFMAAADTILLDTHGCHVFRSLIEVLDETQVATLIAALDETLILNMSTLSQYTRRILQTLFEKHPGANLQTIVDVVAKNARYLAATQQGCISMMRVFEKCTLPQKDLLLNNLLPMFTELAMDPFGNYVVQCALENIEKTAAAQFIVDQFSGKFLRLSCNKFASNVMEKIILLAPASLRRLLLDELVFNPAALQQLVHDNFGNFVVQTIIETSGTPNEHKKICDRLKPLIASSPYGHKIEGKMRSKRFHSNAPRHHQPMIGTIPVMA